MRTASRSNGIPPRRPAPPSRLYSEADCSYFGLVLIPFEEIWWIPVSEIGGRTSICTNIEKDLLAIYRGNTDDLKKRD